MALSVEILRYYAGMAAVQRPRTVAQRLDVRRAIYQTAVEMKCAAPNH